MKRSSEWLCTFKNDAVHIHTKNKRKKISVMGIHCCLIGMRFEWIACYMWIKNFLWLIDYK